MNAFCTIAEKENTKIWIEMCTKKCFKNKFESITQLTHLVITYFGCQRPFGSISIIQYIPFQFIFTTPKTHLTCNTICIGITLLVAIHHWSSSCLWLLGRHWHKQYQIDRVNGKTDSSLTEINIAHLYIRICENPFLKVMT